MPRHHRERWWLQPYGVPEPELQSRILLGLPGALGATWLCLVGPGVWLFKVVKTAENV